MKQNPFSLYDFLGYFIPGAILIYAFVIIAACKELTEITFQNVLKKLPNLSLEGIVFILIISYSFGHILSFISSITVEKYSVWKYGFPSKYLLGIQIPKFSAHFKTYYGFFWGVLILIVLFPIAILDLILGKWLGFKLFYLKTTDSHLQKAIILKVERLYFHLGLGEKKFNEIRNSDFFRIIQHFTFDNTQNHNSKFTNYIALYGFLRTMTLILNVLFWYFVIHFILIEEYSLLSLTILILTAILGYSFFMAFMKFYRKYTLQGFMVLVANKEIK